MPGQYKPLERKKNVDLWDWYSEYKLSLGKAKTSINSYKTHLRSLEMEIQNDFENITLEQIQNINENSQSFVSGFYADCIINRKIKPKTDVMLYLIPESYRKIVQVILD